MLKQFAFLKEEVGLYYLANISVIIIITAAIAEIGICVQFQLEKSTKSSRMSLGFVFTYSYLSVMFVFIYSCVTRIYLQGASQCGFCKQADVPRLPSARQLELIQLPLLF